MIEWGFGVHANETEKIWNLLKYGLTGIFICEFGLGRSKEWADFRTRTDCQATVYLMGGLYQIKTASEREQKKMINNILYIPERYVVLPKSQNVVYQRQIDRLRAEFVLDR